MKAKTFAVVCCLLFIAPAVAILLKKTAVRVGEKYEKAAESSKIGAGKISFCDVCVQIMGEIINELLNIILNIGVLGSCEELCGYLPNKYEQDACDLICAYVGIEEFIRLIEYEDPDPIFFCEEADICYHNDNGTATTLSVSANPASGPAGTKFSLDFSYNVTSYTSSGGPNVVVVPPAGLPLGGSEFVEGQAPGVYSVSFSLDTTPSENDPFTPGSYEVEFALCSGDCSGRHKWSGQYCNGTTSFTITS